MNNPVNQIKKNNPDLKVREIEGLLYILREICPVTNTSFITLTGLPKETLKQFKRSVSAMLEDQDGDLVYLNEKGKKDLKNMDLRPYKWSLYDGVCKDGGTTENDNQSDIYRRINKVKEESVINPKRNFDQFLATSETSYLKAKIIDEKGLVDGKNIAFLGDDDLNSVSLATVNPNFKSAVVFDIDPDILESVENCAKKLGLKNIETVNYDVRRDLDPRFLGKFDVVVFDPPYTKSGVTVFLERAVELLGDAGDFEGKYVLMYYGNSFKSPEKILKIQEVINRFGMSIEDRIEKFARYTGAESIGNASSLYVLKASKFTHKLGFTSDRIYTFEKSKEDKFPFVDHLVFKIFNVDQSILKSKSKMLSILGKICSTHKLKVVDKKITGFKGRGLTITFVLANSNLVAHTWPELGSVHLDVITCTPIYRKENMVDSIKEAFGTSKIETFYIE